jgi:hypothetical protein
MKLNVGSKFWKVTFKYVLEDEKPYMRCKKCEIKKGDGSCPSCCVKNILDNEDPNEPTKIK